MIVVVRVERAPLRSVAWEHSLVRFFAGRLPEIAAPIAQPIEAEGAVVSLWPYVRGRPARRRDPSHAVAAAKVLARLHHAGRDWDGGQKPVRRSWEAAPVEVEGERGPVHGDFFGGNILMRRGRVVGVVDWEESSIDLLAYDLANAVWQFCVDKRRHDFDQGLAAAMLQAYGSDLRPDDLIPLILIRLRWELEVWGAESYLPYWTHVRRSIQKLGG